MKLQNDISLAKFTSFKIGGSARYLAECKTENELFDALRFAGQNNLPFFVLGGGTNMLIRDSGFNGLVIRNQLKEIKLDGELLVAETGLTLPEINNYANQNGLVGFEKLATVPGTLGGALYNNAHWLDNLIAQYIEWVDVVDPQTYVVSRLDNAGLHFGYDHSIFKEQNLVAIRAGIRLVKGDIRESRQELLNYLKMRNQMHPFGTLNSGCMFQNAQANLGPGHGTTTSAGYLIDQCGLKGYKVGAAEISQKHGNFFINHGNASSEDILKLAEICKNKVKEKFGINLEFEIKII